MASITVGALEGKVANAKKAETTAAVRAADSRVPPLKLTTKVGNAKIKPVKIVWKPISI